MAVNKAKKTEILEILKENIKNAQSIGFTSNLGLTMADFNTIRKSLRTVGGTFMLAKKTLIRIAMKEVHGVDIKDEMLPGQVAIICSNGDAVSGLGKVNEAMKEITAKKGGENKIKWVASYFEGMVQ
jgi:ribosomal protein L10